jgi:hypothetical protein
MYKSTEEPVLAHVKKSNEHVLYRVTPVFFDSEMLARGVLIEAESLESESINICLFCYNVQPGIALDYLTGDNMAVNERDKFSVNAVKAKKIDEKIYTGKWIRPVIYMTDAKGGYLRIKKDYSVEYRSNRYPGKATVKITGCGNYYGTRKIFFYIKPARAKITSAVSSGRSVTIKWKKQTRVTGFQIRYSISGKGKKCIVKARGSSIKKTIMSLKKGKKYRFQIRAYKVVEGKTLYGEYSKSKTIRVRRR